VGILDGEIRRLDQADERIAPWRKLFADYGPDGWLRPETIAPEVAEVIDDFLPRLGKRDGVAMPWVAAPDGFPYFFREPQLPHYTQPMGGTTPAERRLREAAHAQKVAEHELRAALVAANASRGRLLTIPISDWDGTNYYFGWCEHLGWMPLDPRSGATFASARRETALTVLVGFIRKNPR